MAILFAYVTELLDMLYSTSRTDLERVMIVIKSKLHILMGNHKIKSILQLSELTKISRASLTKLYNDNGVGVEYATLNTLCKHFNCGIADLLEYVEEKG